MTNSENESDCRLEISDFHTASGEIDDMQNDSETKEVSHPPVRMRPSGQETLPCAGKPLREAASNTEFNKALADDPWNPFSSENNFNLASWLLRSEVAKSQIDTYFAEGLRRTNSRSFWCAYTLRQHLEILDPCREYLVWAEASIDDGRQATSF